MIPKVLEILMFYINSYQTGWILHSDLEKMSVQNHCFLVSQINNSNELNLQNCMENVSFSILIII